MGGLFGGSKPKAPAPDPEVERLRKEAEDRAKKEKADLLEREAEEKLAVKRRLRGSRSLFSNGTSGFADDDKKDNLGND